MSWKQIKPVELPVVATFITSAETVVADLPYGGQIRIGRHDWLRHRYAAKSGQRGTLAVWPEFLDDYLMATT